MMTCQRCNKDKHGVHTCTPSPLVAGLESEVRWFTGELDAAKKALELMNISMTVMNRELNAAREEIERLTERNTELDQYATVHANAAAHWIGKHDLAKEEIERLLTQLKAVIENPEDSAYWLHSATELFAEISTKETDNGH